MSGYRTLTPERLRWLSIGMSAAVLGFGVLDLFDASGAITERSGGSAALLILGGLMACGTLVARVPRAPEIAIGAGIWGLFTAGLALGFRHPPHGDGWAAAQVFVALTLVVSAAVFRRSSAE